MNPLAAVLDTNAVLDWLVFRDPSSRLWAQAVQDGRLHWLLCPRIEAELHHVLRHGAWTRWCPDIEQALTFVSRHARMRPDPQDLPALRPRCSDPSDQVFVDLALCEGARWLITRDRALLKLARKTAGRGLLILRPEGFALEPAAAPD